MVIRYGRPSPKKAASPAAALAVLVPFLWYTPLALCVGERALSAARVLMRARASGIVDPVEVPPIMGDAAELEGSSSWERMVLLDVGGEGSPAESLLLVVMPSLACVEELLALMRPASPLTPPPPAALPRSAPASVDAFAATAVPPLSVQVLPLMEPLRPSAIATVAAAAQQSSPAARATAARPPLTPAPHVAAPVASGSDARPPAASAHAPPAQSAALSSIAVSASGPVAPPAGPHWHLEGWLLEELRRMRRKPDAALRNPPFAWTLLVRAAAAAAAERGHEPPAPAPGGAQQQQQPTRGQAAGGASAGDTRPPTGAVTAASSSPRRRSRTESFADWLIGDEVTGGGPPPPPRAPPPPAQAVSGGTPAFGGDGAGAGSLDLAALPKRKREELSQPLRLAVWMSLVPRFLPVIGDRYTAAAVFEALTEGSEPIRLPIWAAPPSEAAAQPQLLSARPAAGHPSTTPAAPAASPSASQGIALMRRPRALSGNASSSLAAGGGSAAASGAPSASRGGAPLPSTPSAGSGSAPSGGRAGAGAGGRPRRGSSEGTPAPGAAESGGAVAAAGPAPRWVMERVLRFESFERYCNALARPLVAQPTAWTSLRDALELDSREVVVKVEEYQEAVLVVRLAVELPSPPAPHAPRLAEPPPPTSVVIPLRQAAALLPLPVPSALEAIGASHKKQGRQPQGEAVAHAPRSLREFIKDKDAARDAALRAELYDSDATWISSQSGSDDAPMERSEAADAARPARASQSESAAVGSDSDSDSLGGHSQTDSAGEKEGRRAIARRTWRSSSSENLGSRGEGAVGHSGQQGASSIRSTVLSAFGSGGSGSLMRRLPAALRRGGPKSGGAPPLRGSLLPSPPSLGSVAAWMRSRGSRVLRGVTALGGGVALGVVQGVTLGVVGSGGGGAYTDPGGPAPASGKADPLAPFRGFGVHPALLGALLQHGRAAVRLRGTLILTDRNLYLRAARGEVLVLPLGHLAAGGPAAVRPVRTRVKTLGMSLGRGADNGLRIGHCQVRRVCLDPDAAMPQPSGGTTTMDDGSAVAAATVDDAEPARSELASLFRICAALRGMRVACRGLPAAGGPHAAPTQAESVSSRRGSALGEESEGAAGGLPASSAPSDDEDEDEYAWTGESEETTTEVGAAAPTPSPSSAHSSDSHRDGTLRVSPHLLLVFSQLKDLMLGTGQERAGGGRRRVIAEALAELSAAHILTTHYERALAQLMAASRVGSETVQAEGDTALPAPALPSRHLLEAASVAVHDADTWPLPSMTELRARLSARRSDTCSFPRRLQQLTALNLVRSRALLKATGRLCSLSHCREHALALSTAPTVEAAVDANAGGIRAFMLVDDPRGTMALLAWASHDRDVRRQRFEGLALFDRNRFSRELASTLALLVTPINRVRHMGGYVLSWEAPAVSAGVLLGLLLIAWHDALAYTVPLLLLMQCAGLVIYGALSETARGVVQRALGRDKGAKARGILEKLRNFKATLGKNQARLQVSSSQSVGGGSSPSPLRSLRPPTPAPSPPTQTAPEHLCPQAAQPVHLARPCSHTHLPGGPRLRRVHCGRHPLSRPTRCSDVDTLLQAAAQARPGLCRAGRRALLGGPACALAE